MSDDSLSNCHHCHITVPIPLQDLIRSHPLRLSEDMDESSAAEINGHMESSSATIPNPSVHVASSDDIINPTLPNNSSASLQENSCPLSTSSTSRSPSPSHSSQRTSTAPASSQVSNESNTNLISHTNDKQHAHCVSNHHHRHHHCRCVHHMCRKHCIALHNANKSLLPPRQTMTQKTKIMKCGKFVIAVQSGMLIAGYALLMVIGIVVGIVLSRSKHQDQLLSPFPDDHVGSSASPASIKTNFQDNTVRRQGSREEHTRTQIHLQTLKPSTTTTSILLETLLENDNQPRKKAGFRHPDLQSRRKIDDFPIFKSFANLPATKVKKHHPQTPSVSLLDELIPASSVNHQSFSFTTQRPQARQLFNTPQGSPNPSRERKDPDAKIINSWYHTGTDGTFSWGYINTDGSFKNESRGSDCIVRGVYGYVDVETGETLTFPYESGNPCNQNKVDYYYDYDTNSLVFPDGRIVQFQSIPSFLSRTH